MKATYIAHMGTDLSVVNAARVSFRKASVWENEADMCWGAEPRLSLQDKGLIRFLARGCTTGDWENLVNEITKKGMLQSYDGFAVYPVTEEECEKLDLELRDLLTHIRNMPTHWTPFGHTSITLHIKAPIFVARQLGKHQVGTVWNEVSRRYVSDTPELYTPDTFRNAPVGSVKQGSSGKHYDSDDWVDIYVNCSKDLLNLYHQMIKDGVAPEQARMVLPQSMYTEWYWTGNLVSFVNMWKLRTDSHTQRETQQVAHQIGEIIKPLFPVSWQALTQG